MPRETINKQWLLLPRAKTIITKNKQMKKAKSAVSSKPTSSHHNPPRCLEANLLGFMRGLASKVSSMSCLCPLRSGRMGMPNLRPLSNSSIFSNRVCQVPTVVKCHSFWQVPKVREDMFVYCLDFILLLLCVWRCMSVPHHVCRGQMTTLWVCPLLCGDSGLDTGCWVSVWKHICDIW